MVEDDSESLSSRSDKAGTHSCGLSDIKVDSDSDSEYIMVIDSEVGDEPASSPSGTDDGSKNLLSIVSPPPKQRKGSSSLADIFLATERSSAACQKLEG